MLNPREKIQAQKEWGKTAPEREEQRDKRGIWKITENGKLNYEKCRADAISKYSLADAPETALAPIFPFEFSVCFLSSSYI